MELQSISNTTWNRCEFMPVLQTKSICLQLVLTCTFISRSISQPEAKIKSIKNLRWKCWNWSRNSYLFLQKPNQTSDLILLSKFVSTTRYTYVSISKTPIYIKYWLAKQNTGNLNVIFIVMKVRRFTYFLNHICESGKEFIHSQAEHRILRSVKRRIN